MSLSRRRFLQSSTATTTLLALPAATAFGGDSRPKRKLSPENVFDRMSQRSRRVLRLAHRESQELGHQIVRSEHLLLGLIAEAEHSGATWVENLGASLEDFRSVTACVVGSPPEGKHLSGPFSPNAVASLDAGQSAANLMGYHEIEPEHLLMAVTNVPESSANQILQEIWFEESAIQQEATASLRKWSLA